jgi:hypothetical protein
MRCLYCDRPLALLKRITGDGEFCSKEHRRIYQQEHNQLALARLLEAQPKPGAQARQGKTQILQPAPEIVEPAKKPEEPQPEAAGFISDHLEAIVASDATWLAGSPRFENGNPVWESGAKDRRGPQPRAAAFVAESSQAPFSAGSIRRQDRFGFKSPARGPLLGDRLLSNTGAISGPRPAGAGFVTERIQLRMAPGVARASARPQFASLARREPAPGQVVPRSVVAGPRLRPAQFLRASASERTTPVRIRLLSADPRWKPLSPALPAQAPGKIILVLGSFLQRPVRPAGHERLPEAFEIPFQPVSFPPYSPRMERLEERLHRTDRIGFSPP